MQDFSVRGELVEPQFSGTRDDFETALSAITRSDAGSVASGLFDARGATRKIPEVVEPGPTHFAPPDGLDGLDRGRVEQKCPLDPYLVSDSPDGEGGSGAISSLADDNAFEDLYPLPIALDHLYADPHGIARAKLLDPGVGFDCDQIVSVHISVALTQRARHLRTGASTIQILLRLWLSSRDIRNST